MKRKTYIPYDKRPADTKEDRMCKRKHRYDTYEAAKFFGGVNIQRIYACEFCGGFHATTKGKINGAKV